MKKKVRILCFGEAMVELSALDFANKSSQIGFAGDTLNTAIYLKRLFGSRAQVDYLTVLGRDLFSEQLKKYIDSENVGTGCIRQTTSRSVGLYAISIDSVGERQFSYWRDQSAARLLFDHDDDFVPLCAYDLVYFSGISLAILHETARDKLFRHFERQRRNFKIAFDSNYRPNLWKNKKTAQLNIQRAFNLCDIALPSLDDQMKLLNVRNEAAVVSWFKDNEIKQTILKRGAKGPRLIGKVNQHCDFGSQLHVIDSTAAGDGFNAGYLAAYFNGKSDFQSARHGHELAKIVISYLGAICPRNALPSV